MGRSIFCWASADAGYYSFSNELFLSAKQLISRKYILNAAKPKTQVRVVKIALAPA